MVFKTKNRVFQLPPSISRRPSPAENGLVKGARFETSVGEVDAGQGTAQAVRGQAVRLGDLTKMVVSLEF